MNENKRRGGRVSAERSHAGTRAWKGGGIHPRKVSGFVHQNHLYPCRSSSGGASRAAAHRRSDSDRRKNEIRTYMQPSITSNPSTKRPKLHPRGSQSPT